MTGARTDPPETSFPEVSSFRLPLTAPEGERRQRMNRAQLASLEPPAAVFQERDAAGLCIDCGKAPQPPRRRGEPETPHHHRCDPCHQVYNRRQELRRSLCDTVGLFYASSSSSDVCSECEGDIPAGEYRFGFALTDANRWCCVDCAAAARFEIAPAAAVPSISISVACVPKDPEFPPDLDLFLIVRVPRGVPALFALGATFVRAVEATFEIQAMVGYADGLEHIDLQLQWQGDDVDMELVLHAMATLAAGGSHIARQIFIPLRMRQLIRRKLYNDNPRIAGRIVRRLREEGAH